MATEGHRQRHNENRETVFEVRSLANPDWSADLLSDSPIYSDDARILLSDIRSTAMAGRVGGGQAGRNEIVPPNFRQPTRKPKRKVG